MTRELLVLGFGYVGRYVCARAPDEGLAVTATTREAVASDDTEARGVSLRRLNELDATNVRALVSAQTSVLVTFPPDGVTDGRIAPALGHARAVVYVSTTGVYGHARGHVDELTPVDRASLRARQRLDAEALYLDVGATVLRCAGIYGPGRGLHERIASGTFRMPGDGSNVVSRIHVDDLASIILRGLDGVFCPTPGGQVFVVADDTPVPQREAIGWLCERLGCPWPRSVAPGEAPETLRHDRRVDNQRVKRALGIALRYPSYREGFAAEITRGTSANAVP